MQKPRVFIKIVYKQSPVIRLRLTIVKPVINSAYLFLNSGDEAGFISIRNTIVTRQQLRRHGKSRHLLVFALVTSKSAICRLQRASPLFIAWDGLCLSSAPSHGRVIATPFTQTPLEYNLPPKTADFILIT